MSSMGHDCSLGLKCEDRSLTKQSFAKEADINNILAGYRRTGRVDYVNSVLPKFGDFTQVTDFQGAVSMVLQANSAFMELDASVRDRFKNDPNELIKFVGNPDNYDEALELGLVNKRPDPAVPVKPLPPGQNGVVPGTETPPSGGAQG